MLLRLELLYLFFLLQFVLIMIPVLLFFVVVAAAAVVVVVVAARVSLFMMALGTMETKWPPDMPLSGSLRPTMRTKTGVNHARDETWCHD